VLTVRQPWAWALITGRKDIENRSGAWRGSLLHADAEKPAAHALRDVAELAGVPMPADEPCGAIVGATQISADHAYERAMAAALDGPTQADGTGR
jgi:hypothetical protein